MYIPNNSVGRLHEILRQFQKKNSGKMDPLCVVIGKVFDVDPSNTSQILSIQLELLNLIKVSKEEISRLPITSHELHLRALRKIEAAFSTHHLQSTWASFNEYLDPSTMTGLEHTADTLSYSGEKIIDEDDLKNLENQVNELLQLAIEMNTNSKLKKFLLEQLNKIREAILYYRINGAKGLREALEKIMGAGIIFGEENNSENTPETIRPKFQLMFELLVRLVAFANDIKGLTGIDPLLLPKLP